MGFGRMVAVAGVGMLAIGFAGQSSTAAPQHVTGFNGVMHSSVAGCPDIAWRLARNGNDVSGMAFYANMSGASQVKGTVDNSGQINLTLTSIMGNGPVGTVEGHRTKNGTTATLKGEGCANGRVAMRPVTDINHWTNFGGGGQ